MRRKSTRLGRVAGTALLSVAVVAAPLTVGAGAAHALTTPVSGAACGVDDVGRRAPQVATYQVVPVITHFSAVNVAAGSNTDQSYSLAVTDSVVSTVGVDTTLTAKFSALGFSEITSATKVSVSVANTHTELTTITQIWRFVNPGYYGLYKGVLKITGTMNSLQCESVADATGARSLRWTPHPIGSYTAFGAAEQGSVRCEERYPAATIRTSARTTLCGNVANLSNPAAAAKALNAALARKGAAAVAAARKQLAARPSAQVARPGATATAAAVPASLTCDPGYLRLLTADKTLAVGVDATGGTAVLKAASAGTVTHWQDCHTAGAVPQHVLIARDSLAAGAPSCLDLMSAGVTEGAPLKVSPCSYRVNQRFVLYTDPVSAATGLQSADSGSMVGPTPLEPFEGDGLSQDSLGRADGLGTFYTEHVA